MKVNLKNKVRVSLMIALAVLGTIMIANAPSAPTRTWNLGGGCTLGPFTYRFYVDTSTYLACNGKTGLNDFSSTDFVSLVGSVVTASSGSGVYSFESATYPVTGNLFGTSSLTNLLVQGVPGGTIFQLTPGADRQMINLAATPMSNVTFNGITFDGNAASQTDVNGIAMLTLTNTGNSHVRLENIVCKNNRSGACIDFHGYDLTITNSKFLFNNGNFGASAFASDHIHIGFATNLRVSNNYFQDCTDTSLAMDSVTYVTVTGNSFFDCGHQLLTITSFGGGGVSTTSTNVTITGNTFLQNKYDAPAIHMDLFGGTANPCCFGIAITGNTIMSTRPTAQTQGLVFIVNAREVTFLGNIVRMVTTNQNSYLVQINTVHGITMSGNTFSYINSSPAGKAMFLSGLVSFTIMSNSFRNIFQAVTFQSLQSSIGIVTGNTFESVAQPFLFSSSPPTTSVEVHDNAGFPAVSFTLGAAFAATPCGVCTYGLWNGTTATPTASTVYTTVGSGMIVSSTGGTGVSISILNPNGITIASGLATLTAQYIPWRYQINFGAFSVAPTVTVALAS